ncbi:MAG: ferrous iron transport protein A [Clostridia bacterium]|nr:ferrous iron transport protein A [Clostridia bacterium]
MFKVASLNDLKEGQKCVVDDIAVSGDIKRRLMDLGIIKGAVVECGIISPGGDPKAFYIKGALIALREEDSSKIYIKAYDGANSPYEKGCVDE